MLSPAWAESIDLLNISTPVTTVFLVGRMPTTSISSFSPILPDSTLPVATVPLPWMVNTSSTAKKEVPIYVTLWLGDVLIYSFKERQNRGLSILRIVPLQSPQGTSYDHGDVISWELVLREELPYLHLHQLKKLRVIDHVGLVQVDHYVGNPYLPGQEDVLSGLGHRTIGRTDHKYCPIHLGSTGYHVLYVVGMPWAVHVGVVAIFGGVLLVGGGNCDAPLALFWGVVYLIEGHLSVCGVVWDLLCKDPSDGRGEGGLTVVDVADGTDV